MTIIVPILPGKTEAWRRLLQELSGSRREELREWCAHLGIGELKIWLSETIGVSLAVVCFHDVGAGPLAGLDDAPFMRWLSKQLLDVHGVDLSALLAGHSRSLLLEF